MIAYSSSGLPVSFVSSNTAVATIVGNLVYLNSVGETTISAIQMGDTRYHPANPKSQVLRVIQPIPKDEQVIDFDEIPIKVRMTLHFWSMRLPLRGYQLALKSIMVLQLSTPAV